MSEKVAEIASLFQQDDTSQWVSFLWDKFNNQRSGKIEEWLELRDYIFATDTSTTSNAALPWKNSTTIPKLTQIRDNLHSNYLSALFPNDKWLKWEAYSKEAAKKEKAQTIEAYMENKTRESDYRAKVSQLLYDYIDYGNVFGTVKFESKYREMADGSTVPVYVGPRAVRISPLDIVFNPMAASFEETWKIVRSVKSLGEIKRLAEEDPEQQFWTDALKRREELRQVLGKHSVEDFQKAVGYSADGFGNMYEYFMSDFIEILEFYGDYHDAKTGDLHTRKIITVVDRSLTVREDDIPTWFGNAPIFHVGWRMRTDNLWAMGPLDNLVGMQYRLDHLENLKADAMDLSVHPPLGIFGEVEDFVWGPGAEIHIGENGSVQELTKSLQGLFTADSQIQWLQDQMELMAGAPREAMGVRTPGEKTATEFSELQNAAGRIFQEKINHFEMMFQEKLLNAMLETAVRHMDTSDIIRIQDKALGAVKFKEITRDDIVANGVLRPIGARHFAKQAQELQNITAILGGPIGEIVAPHTSGKALTEFVNDVTGLRAYDVFKHNIAIEEQQETQQRANMAEEELLEQDADMSNLE